MTGKNKFKQRNTNNENEDSDFINKLKKKIRQQKNALSKIIKSIQK